MYALSGKVLAVKDIGEWTHGIERDGVRGEAHALLEMAWLAVETALTDVKNRQASSACIGNATSWG